MPEETSPLTVEEYEIKVILLKNQTQNTWSDLLARVEITSPRDAIRVALVKWRWIKGLRYTQCAFCEYQKSLQQELHCEGCLVRKACTERDTLTAQKIVEALAALLHSEEVPSE